MNWLFWVTFNKWPHLSQIYTLFIRFSADHNHLWCIVRQIISANNSTVFTSTHNLSSQWKIMKSICTQLCQLKKYSIKNSCKKKMFQLLYVFNMLASNYKSRDSSRIRLKPEVCFLPFDSGLKNNKRLGRVLAQQRNQYNQWKTDDFVFVLGLIFLKKIQIKYPDKSWNELWFESSSQNDGYNSSKSALNHIEKRILTEIFHQRFFYFMFKLDRIVSKDISKIA